MARRLLTWAFCGLLFGVVGCGGEDDGPTAARPEATKTVNLPPAATDRPTQNVVVAPPSELVLQPPAAPGEEPTYKSTITQPTVEVGATPAPSAPPSAPAAAPKAVPPAAPKAAPKAEPTPAKPAQPIDAKTIAVPPLKDLAGLRAAVEKHKGKVVMVNFWATWCPPCVEEFPDLVALRDKHAGDLVLLTVSGDEAEDLDTKVKPFLARHGVGGNTYLAQLTDEAGFAKELGWNGQYPVTLIYNRAGERIEVIEGGQDAATFEAAVQRAM